MKHQEALDIIGDKLSEQIDRPGYLVHFEAREGGLLRSDSFPDVREGEVGIETESEAWRQAEAFRKATNPDQYVNIYVTFAQDFKPVAGYERRKLRNYP